MSEPWVHYARFELEEFPPPCDPCLDRPSVKPASWCLYFARGTKWRDWAQANLTPRGYTHKYELANWDALNILTIDMSFVNAVELMPDSTFIWSTLVEAGCDGVLVCRDEIMAAVPRTDPWFVFASARESDELVIWQNAQLIERRLDWAKEYYLRSHARESELATKWKAENGEVFAELLQLRALETQEN
jgi:hypothetical protein